MLPPRPALRCLLPALLCLLTCAARGTTPPPAKADQPTALAADEPALSEAARDLCSRDIVLLGESATHGDGHTETFKVALVEHLVTACGFNSVFFESSGPEFVRFNQHLRARDPVTPADLGASIGGLWNADSEFQPLLPFLLDRARAGTLFLGGIDDQLGQRGQPFSNDTLPLVLTAGLPPAERDLCRTALHDRIYASDPVTAVSEAQLTSCLTDSARTLPSTQPETLQLLASTRHWVDRALLPDPQATVARDRSMFRNFDWLLQHDPQPHPRVIVWTATVHASKRADPTRGDRSGTNFGSLVHRRFGRRAFALGFSAAAGSFRQGGHLIHPIPLPAPDALESRALRGTSASAVYLGPVRLRALSPGAAAPFRHTTAQNLLWPALLDGLVIFREEFPPTPAHLALR